jgi:hypothetical protein
VEIEAPAGKEPRVREEGREGGESKAPAAAESADAGERKPETLEPAVQEDRPAQQEKRETKAVAAASPLPSGTALLDKIRPHMRRNRRGPGGSGSTTFLSRALRTNEAELKGAFAAMGLIIPALPSDKPVYSEIGNEVWWLNLDSRGGLWINGREKKEGESLTPPSDAMVEAPLEAAPGSAASDAVPAPEVAPAVASAGDFTAPPAEAPPPEALKGESETEISAGENAPLELKLETTAERPSSPGAAPASTQAAPANSALTAVRSLLKETKTGAVAGKVDRLADELGKPAEEIVATLVDAGFRVPEKPREKPVFVEHGGEILWLNKTTKGELWLNAKAPKVAGKDADSDESEEVTEPSEGGEGEGEKKPARRGARGRTTKKVEGKEGSEGTSEFGVRSS